MFTTRYRTLFIAPIFFLLGSGLLFAQTVSFDDDSSTYSESAGAVQVAVTATAALTVEILVGGNAQQNVDYTRSPSSLTFIGPSTQYVTVSITDDPNYEGDETVQLTLSNPSVGGYGAYRDHYLIITNNDPAPTIQFSLSGSTVNESIGTANVQLRLTPVESGLPTSVNYVVSDGTATGGGTDYIKSPPSGQFTIPANNLTANFPVTIVDDDLFEHEETIIISISTPVNAQPIIPTATHTLKIAESDSEPTVRFDPTASSISEHDTTIAIPVSLTEISGEDAVISYTVGGTASGGNVDHNLASDGSVTINAGNLDAAINVPIKEDALDESNETIVITLASAVDAEIDLGQRIYTLTILDDDLEPNISFNSTSSSGAENTSPATFRIEIDAVSGRQVKVDYVVISGGTASADGVDYDLFVGQSDLTTTGTVTLEAGETFEDVQASITDDNLDESNETFTLRLQNPVNAVINESKKTHTYTIMDNDSPPTVQFTLAEDDGSEGVQNHSFEVKLSTKSGLPVSVGYSVVGGTAINGTDYTLSTGTAVIAAGSLNKSVPFTVNIADDTDEPDETIVIALSQTPTNAVTGSQDTMTYTIIDDDPPPNVAFSLPSSNADEVSTAPSFNLVLSDTSAFAVKVVYSVTGGTATGGGVDYTLPSDTVVINAGQVSGSFSATIIPDALYENDETIVISLTYAVKAGFGSQRTHTYTINDDDEPPTIKFTTTSGSNDENAGTVTPTIQLSAASGLTASVDYSIAGTALGGTDYILNPGTATITGNLGKTDTILSIIINEDAIYESDETIRIALSNPVNATLGADSVFTYTIVNEDSPPVIQFALSISGGDEVSTPASIQIVLSTASAVTATVDYAVTGGTATGGVDYTLESGRATIYSGQTSTTVSLDVIDDIFDEPNETVIITLSNPIDATLGSKSIHTYTINDDDDAPTVGFTAFGSSGDEGNSPVNLPVVLSAASELTITVDYAITGGTATGGGTDYTLAGGKLTFPPGTTLVNIKAVIIDDQLVEDDETITLALSNAVNAQLGTMSTHTYSILDNDDPPVDFTVGTVVASGGTVVTGYWNATNTGVKVTIPVDTSTRLIGGSIQLEAKVGSGSYEVLGSAYTIAVADTGKGKVLSIAAGVFKGLTGFDDDSTVTVRAVISDAAGNSTTGSPSSSIILIDQIPPAAFKTGAVVPTGGTVVTGYWNRTNTGISVVVPLVVSDLSLSGGTVQPQAEADGSFESLGPLIPITQANVTSGSKTVAVADTEVTAIGVEELTGFSDGDVLTFKSILTDVAGNTTTYSLSDSSLSVDETPPTAAITYSDTLANQGDTVTITLTVNEAATASPQISIAYAVNTTLPAAMTATAAPAVWSYDAIMPAGNDGLVTVSITARDLAGNALTAGNTTGRTELLLDNTPPGYVLSYSDSLVKAGDMVTIT
ncbi:MAG: Calx-beta domain-containing protein, partial [Candidatus Neomarinimicrobiota bacterium]